jgi:hypothetical protein
MRFFIRCLADGCVGEIQIIFSFMGIIKRYVNMPYSLFFCVKFSQNIDYISSFVVVFQVRLR